MRKYHIITHGCQMNDHDSERIAAILENLGYEKTESPDRADFILFNTCLVRENAELKVFGQVGALKGWREADPKRILAVSGCMMQTGPARDIIRDKYPQVDLVFGTKNIEKLPILLKELEEEGRVFDTSTYSVDGSDLDIAFDRKSSFSAYVNIMTGCDNFCSYCIVPYARGREASRPPREVFEEVTSLAKAGYKEITLLGQNVNSYGKDFQVDFPSLLAKVAETPGIDRVRFMSSHPKDLSDDLIRVIAQYPNIERHFHLPLQSGSDKVLREMNRHYSSEDYLALVNKLRETVPDITMTTDIIVGFPGESEKDHQATLDLCRKVEYDNAFTFIYSVRPGTRAGEREDQVPDPIKSRRYQELCDVLYPIFNRKNQAMVGKRVEVLFDGQSKNDPRKISGRDSGYHLIHVPGDQNLVGQIRQVEVTEANSFALMGRVLN